MFFDWLDSGRGALIDLPSCPRRLLEERKVLYLSREELKLCQVRRLARACLASCQCHALRFCLARCHAPRACVLCSSCRCLSTHATVAGAAVHTTVPR